VVWRVGLLTQGVVNLIRRVGGDYMVRLDYSRNFTIRFLNGDWELFPIT